MENGIDNTTIPLKIINEQIEYIQNIIQNTVISLEMYNKYELFSNNDMNQYTSSLNCLLDKSKEITNTLETTNDDAENYIQKIQNIIDELTQIVSKIGTLNIQDLIYMTFGSDFLKNNDFSTTLKDKYELLLQNVHPIGFKSIRCSSSKQINSKCTTNKLFHDKDNEAICLNKNTDETHVIENSQQLECFDVDINLQQ